MASDNSNAPCSHCKQPEDKRLLRKYDGLCLNCSNAGVPDLLGTIAELRAENANYRRWFGCPACGEDHATQSICPPRETRTTGLAWFHSAVRNMRDEIAELRAERDRLLSFIRSFLNPEERGHAVPDHVRDDVRELLGMKRVES